MDLNRSRPPARNNSYYRQNSPSMRDDGYRGQSPGYQYNNNRNNRGFSPGKERQYSGQGSRYQNSYRNDDRNPRGSANIDGKLYQDVGGRPPTPYNKNLWNDRSVENEVVFDAKEYLEKFGKPPSPCPNCGGLHWVRHCLWNLNWFFGICVNKATNLGINKHTKIMLINSLFWYLWIGLTSRRGYRCHNFLYTWEQNHYEAILSENTTSECECSAWW